MRGRNAALAVLVAIAAYGAWIAAAADDFGPSGLWTILAGAAFWIAVLFTVAYLITVVVRVTRRRRRPSAGEAASPSGGAGANAGRRSA